MSSNLEPEIVKWYTNARRFPQLIGKTPDGAKIWGGPYTYTQVFAGVGLLLIGLRTTWLWGRFGTVGNVVVLIGVAYGATLLIGRLPLGSRNPLAVLCGLVTALTAPEQGKYGGRKFGLARPHRVASRVQIEHADKSTAAASGSPAAPPTSTEPSSPGSPAQAPASSLSGVQQLLAAKES